MNQHLNKQYIWFCIQRETYQMTMCLANENINETDSIRKFIENKFVTLFAEL